VSLLSGTLSSSIEHCCDAESSDDDDDDNDEVLLLLLLSLQAEMSLLPSLTSVNNHQYYHN